MAHSSIPSQFCSSSVMSLHMQISSRSVRFSLLARNTIEERVSYAELMMAEWPCLSPSVSPECGSLNMQSNWIFWLLFYYKYDKVFAFWESLNQAFADYQWANFLQKISALFLKNVLSIFCCSLPCTQLQIPWDLTF